MHFPSLEESWNLGKMAEVMEKSWNFLFLAQIYAAVWKLGTFCLSGGKNMPQKGWILSIS